MKIMKKYFFLIVLLSVVTAMEAQRRKINLTQSDSRFTIRAEAFYNFVNDEEIWYYVQNNTNEKYQLEVEVTVNSSCHPSNTYKLGVNKVVFLNPGAQFTPSSDWSHILIGSSTAKACRRTLSDKSYTFITGITYRYVSVRNLSAEEKLKAEEKAKKESEALELKKKKEADMLAEKEKKEAEALKQSTQKEADEVKKKKEEEAQNTKLAKETPKNTANKTAEKSTATEADDTEKSSSDAKKNEAENARAKAAEDTRMRQQEREEAAERARQEEARQAQARQQEYDTWKEGAQKERDEQDIINTAATLSIFTLLGGFIYEGMGTVDPYSVYRSPAKRFVPKFFLNSDFGFSFSSNPILFQSSYSTMSGGTSSTANSLIGQDGYYLNLNAEARIGAGNDFYSFYGLIGGKFGLVPTFTGTRYAMEYGGGADIGIKNIKLFGQYRAALADEKSMTLSDVEENGSGELSALSTEISYGLKITFGGEPEDDFKRSHIYLGMMSKQYTIDGNTQFYDPDLNTIRSGSIKPIEGYMFEWRKDHTFRLFFRYYPEYNYIGSVDSGYSLSSGLRSSGAFFEIGFLRSVDFF
jgi:hypothetical protein